MKFIKDGRTDSDAGGTNKRRRRETKKEKTELEVSP